MWCVCVCVCVHNFRSELLGTMQVPDRNTDRERCHRQMIKMANIWLLPHSPDLKQKPGRHYNKLYGGTMISLPKIVSLSGTLSLFKLINPKSREELSSS